MIFHSYVSLPEGIAKSYKSSKPTLQPRCSQPNSQWLFRVISPFCGFNLGICQLYMSFFLVLGIYVHRFIGVKLDKHLIVRCLCWFLSTFLLLLRGVSQEREVVKNWWTRPTNSTGWTKTRVKPLTKRDVHPQFWFGDYPIAVYIYIPFYSHVGDFTALSENRVPQKLMVFVILFKIAIWRGSPIYRFLDIVMDWTNK